MARRDAVRTPPNRACLRRSIELFGVIHPVLMTPGGEVIDGAARMEIATELGKPYKVVISDTRAPIDIARWMQEDRLREADERTSAMSAQIVRLASEQTDGVGAWSEAAIAGSLGVSVDHVLHIMRRHLAPSEHDVRDLFPAKRRRSDGSIGDAAVTTVEVEPIVAEPEPVTMPGLHPVYDYIPASTPEQRGTLRASLEKNGQRTPILLDQDGLIVDGRARWEILAEMGVTPETKTITTNPWVAALEANVARFPDVWDRVLILAKLPPRPSATQPNDMRPPTVAEAAQTFRVTTYIAKAMRLVVANGNDEVVQAVRDEVMKLGTALRLIREVPPEQWSARIAAMRATHEVGAPVALPMDAGRSLVSTYRRGRTDRVTVDTAETAIAALEALGMVLDGSEGLDPRITREQAGDLLSRLSTARRPLGRLTTMLKQRKETT